MVTHELRQNVYLATAVYTRGPFGVHWATLVTSTGQLTFQIQMAQQWPLHCPSVPH